MNRTEKNKTKLLSRIFNISAWVCVLDFITLFVLCVSRVIVMTGTPNVLTLKVILVFSPIFVGLVLSIIGTHYHAKLKSHKAKLLNAKQNFYARKIIDNLAITDEHDIQAAVNIYNDCLKSEYYKTFFHGYFIAEFIRSDDPKWRTKANIHLQKLLKEI